MPQMASTRSYVQSVAGGTATASVQIQAKGSIKAIMFSAVDAAAGTWEVSESSASQIGTAQPTKDVITRLRLSGTAGRVTQLIPVSVPVVAFQTIYIHSTGAGNVGDVTLVV